MTMITPSYLGETIEYSSLHACRSTLEDPTAMSSEREIRGSGSKQFRVPRSRGSFRQASRKRHSSGWIEQTPIEVARSQVEF